MAKLFNNDTIGTSYQEQLRKEHQGSNWGATGAKYSGADVRKILTERPYITSVLDFGAGKGSMGRFIQEEYGYDVEWTNYDPGIPEYDTLPTKQFDLVISTDVLEHIEPDKLSSVIKTLAELTGKVLYSNIACSLTGFLFDGGPYDGQDIHLSVHSPYRWRELFALDCPLQEAEYQHREKRSKGGSKTRCMMIHERV